MAKLDQILLTASKNLFRKRVLSSKLSILKLFPGQISKYTTLEIKETKNSMHLRFRTSKLALDLDSGKAYRTPPSLPAIRKWAKMKGIPHKAVPIWQSLKKKGQKEVHKNFLKGIPISIKESLREES